MSRADSMRSRSRSRSRRRRRRRNGCSSRLSFLLCLSGTSGLPRGRCRGREGWRCRRKRRRRRRDDGPAGGAEAVGEGVDETDLGRAGVVDLKGREGREGGREGGKEGHVSGLIRL